MKQSLLEMLEGLSVQCAEKSARDERFKRLQKTVSDYADFVRRPEADEHTLSVLLLSNEIYAVEQEGLLDAETASVLKRSLNLIRPPNPNAGKELYRMAYGPWWRRLFRC